MGSEMCIRDRGKLYATLNGVEASKKSHVKIVAVPTLLKTSNGKKSDLSLLISAIETIAHGLKVGDLVIIESSVPPGTTEGIVREVLEGISNLKVEVDFGLAYSPERVMEGRALQDIVENYPKIVSGFGVKSLRAVKSLYEVVAKKGVIALSSPRAAELEKLVEGIYRDVNIALANEIARLCRVLQVDFEEVRVAANSQPFSHLHKPGTGVGGPCIPVYPYFLMEVAEKYNLNLELVKSSRLKNESMPKEVVSIALEALSLHLERVEGVKVAVLGLAFRGDIGDSRLSPTYDVIEELIRRGFRNIIVHDPYINRDEKLLKYNVKLVNNLKEALKGASLVIISTEHTPYKNLTLKEIKTMSENDKLVVVDGRHVIREYKSPPAGVAYVGIGRPLTIGNNK